MGFTTTREEYQFILWNVPVEVEADNQTLLLSQTNGFVGKSYFTKSERQRIRENKKKIGEQKR
ncbi:MAG: hypothetical protein WKF74_10860 [Pyrinomonadaceae bacterium]